MAAYRGTDRQDDLEERVGQAMRESCISILISMVTGAFVCTCAHTHVDAVCFLVALITAPVPAVHLFCTYTFVAILFTLVYTLTFLAAILVLFGQLERANRHTWFFTRTIDAGTVDIGMWHLNAGQFTVGIRVFLRQTTAMETTVFARLARYRWGECDGQF
jgi:hypothetical protein